ncbi:MAG: hypothetical protein H6738_12015 [Alphaproteobacteria bacterium]|nr:hypothetical protein [Alphaproteobacteria bacterium]MCB9694946.1 hypothetical protein [Alphaproteobacteria bacterium]MCB9697498.1 hypothetical protein [Alphaproteobacteria bacterium]
MASVPRAVPHVKLSRRNLLGLVEGVHLGRTTHEAQLLTYLRLSDRKSGLLLNFKVKLLRDGITPRVL